MAVTPFTAVTQGQMNQLATLAASTGTVGSPYKFLPPVRIFANQDSILRWYEAENAGSFPGGIAIITGGGLRALRLQFAPHTDLANWAAPSNFRVWNGGTAPTGVRGDWGCNLGTFGAPVLRWDADLSPPRWVVYGGWATELKRMRAACFNRLFSGGFSGSVVHQREGDWYAEPAWSARSAFYSDVFWPWNIANSWETRGFRQELFKGCRYIYADNGTTTTADVVTNFRPSSFTQNYHTGRDRFGFLTTLTSDASFRCKGRFGSNQVLLNFTIAIDLGPTLQNVTSARPVGRVSNTLTGCTVTEQVVGQGMRYTFQASNVTWDGTTFDIGVSMNAADDPNFEWNVRASGGQGGTIRFVNILTSNRPVKGIHGTLPLKQITLKDAPPNDPPPICWAWGFIFSAGANGEYGWIEASSNWLLQPTGVTNGIVVARPVPLSNVEFDPFLPTLSGGTALRSILQRYARARSTSGGSATEWTSLVTTIDEEQYSISSVIIYNVPRMYCRQVTAETTQEDLEYQRQLYMYGSPQVHDWSRTLVMARGMVYSVTCVRPGLGDPVRIPQFTGPAISVDIGFLRGGDAPSNFVSLQTVTIPVDARQATIYPQWVNLDGTSLAYRCNEVVDVQASIVPASPGSSVLFDSTVQDVYTGGRATPIMAIHYNDTEKMLTST